MTQGRPVEVRQHDAEAPLHRHLAQHLRRRGAGGEGRAGHARLPPGDPARETGFEQFHDLTWRPGVDVRKGAFADLLPQGSLHGPFPRREKKTPATAKDNPLAPRPQAATDFARGVSLGRAASRLRRD